MTSTASNFQKANVVNAVVVAVPIDDVVVVAIDDVVVSVVVVTVIAAVVVEARHLCVI